MRDTNQQTLQLDIAEEPPAQCRRCLRKLRSAKARANGIGPVCIKKEAIEKAFIQQGNAAE